MKTSFAVLLVLLCQVLFGLNVELQVKECAGVGTTGGYPISSVVPLPYGEYQDISKFRVTNDGGANVPAQFTVLNRNWMEDRSIANLLVNFQPTVSAYSGAGTGISKYYLKDDGTGNATGTGLQLTENSNTITVVTGPLKFTVSKTAFNIISELWLDKNGNGTYESSEQIINSHAQNGGVFTGRLSGDIQFDASRNDVTVTVEESGPMRVVIKAQAQTIYNSTVDHKHGYGVRIYAYAEKPYIKIDYQLQNSAKNKGTAWPLYFESMNVDFRLNMGGSPTVRVGTQNSQTYQRSRDNGLYLAQESSVKYNVYDLQSKASLSNGTKCPGYLDISDGSTGVAAITRYMQQLWPNGLSIDPANKLQIQLFPEWSCEWTEPNYVEGYPIHFSSTGLYWLEDMQFVYKEMMLVFHNGSMSSDELDRLAKTLEFPPVAAIPTGWYAQTRMTFDMGSIIPYDQKIETVDTQRTPEVSTSQDGTGWDWLKSIDGRKATSSGVGGWPQGQGAFIVTENPRDYYDAEQYALGEINIKPLSMVDYNYERDFNLLQLGTNGIRPSGGRSELPFDIISYRCSRWGFDTSMLASTERNACARDYQHMWYYHVADAYFITGNPWIKDWYSFMGELLKSQTGDTFPESDFMGTGRGNGHAASNALTAYRITGDTVGYNMAHYFLYKRMAAYVDPLSGYIGSSPWTAGFGLRAMVDYMESVKENSLRWQQFVEVFSKISGMMEHNYNYGNFAYAGASPFAASSSNIGSASCWLDPVAWYYWNTGKRKYFDHAMQFINTGIGPGGSKALYANGEWSGEWAGRDMQYVREHEKGDMVPPAAITDLTLTRNSGTVTLDWTAPADAKRYIVVWGNHYIAEESTIDTNQLNWWAANVIGPSFFAAPGLKQSISFAVPSSGLICAAILSFDTAYNLSPMSNRAMTDNTPPNQPGNLQAVYIDAGHQAALSWSLSTDPESGVKYYNVYRNGTRIASALALSFTDTDLKEATAYTYEVAAVNGLLVEGTRNSFLLTTPVDVMPPAIVKVQAVNSANEVKVFFSEQVDSASAVNKSNYTLSQGKTVLSVKFQPDGKSVVLTCDNLVFGTQYVLTANNIKDRAGNANVLVNGQASFTYREPFTISDGWCNTGFMHDMDWNVIEKDKEVYIDWPMSISIFPDEYLHAPLLRLLSDKVFTGLTADESAFGFTTNKEVIVIVAFDDAERTAGRAPSWLTTGFVDKGKDIIAYDKSSTYTGSNPCYSLYEKKFPAGKVEINGKGGSVGWGYFLIVIPTDSSFVYTPPIRTEDTIPDNEYVDGMSTCPNPFNPQVNITVRCGRVIDPVKSHPSVRIFNMQGRLVAKLAPSGIRQACHSARYEYSWNGAGYASGAYLVSAKYQSKTWKKAVVLLK